MMAYSSNKNFVITFSFGSLCVRIYIVLSKAGPNEDLLLIDIKDLIDTCF